MIKSKLSERLTKIAGFVPRGHVVADIGTDHALLSIYLVLEGISSQVIASDLSTGPLSSARANVYLYKLEKSIEIRQGNGLESINPGEADVVIIAGMGGVKIIEILEGSHAVLDGVVRIILQPQGGAGMVRRWLFDHHWQIVDEELVLEHDNYYEIIVSEPSPGPKVNDIDKKLSRREMELLEIGPCLLEKEHPLLIPFLQEKIKLAKNILISLRHAKTPAARKMRQEWRRKILLFRRIIDNVS